MRSRNKNYYLQLHILKIVNHSFLNNSKKIIENHFDLSHLY